MADWRWWDQIVTKETASGADFQIEDLSRIAFLINPVVGPEAVSDVGIASQLVSQSDIQPVSHQSSHSTVSHTVTQPVGQPAARTAPKPQSSKYYENGELDTHASNHCAIRDVVQASKCWRGCS